MALEHCVRTPELLGNIGLVVQPAASFLLCVMKMLTAPTSGMLGPLTESACGRCRGERLARKRGSSYVSATRPWSGRLSPALPCVLEGGGGEDAFALSATPPSRSGGLTSHRRDLCWHFLGCGVLKGISRRKKEFMGPRLSHLACEQHRS